MPRPLVGSRNLESLCNQGASEAELRGHALLPGFLSLGEVQLPARGGFSFTTVKPPSLGELQWIKAFSAEFAESMGCRGMVELRLSLSSGR